MSNVQQRYKLARKRDDRKNIPLPDGDELVPRKRFANDELQMTEAAVRNLNLPTLYLSCVAYIPRKRSLQIIAERATVRNEEPKRRGRA
jgi:hypothetical protein